MLSVRPASEKDALDLLKWRNDPLTREMSIDSEPVALRDHLAWLRNVLVSPKEMLLLGAIDDEKIGMCRFSINSSGTQAEVSINLAPHHRGRNFASKLLQSSITTFLRKIPIDLTARIKPHNAASLKVFEKSQFLLEPRNSIKSHYSLVRLNSQNNVNLDYTTLSSCDLSIERVTGLKHQVETLYTLLNLRPHTISHDVMPTFESHSDFVSAHPYRLWLLIKSGSSYIGSIYVTYQNTIAVNLNASGDRARFTSNLIDFLKDSLVPLPACKSTRPRQFCINVPETDAVLRETLRELQCQKLQSTFSV